MRPVLRLLAMFVPAAVAMNCGGRNSSGIDAASHDARSGGSADAGSADASSTAPPTPPPQVPSGWNLALDDEFDGSALGPTWTVGTNLGSFVQNGVTYWNPYVPGEGEYLTGSMVAVQNSNLIMSSKAASGPITGPTYGSKSFISGYVTSYGNFAFQYGYAEFRIKLPEVASGAMTGLWPAIWLLNSTYANADEIDVLESFGGDQTAIQMTAQPSNFVTPTLSPGWHVIAVLHETSKISFYVDNVLIQAFDQSMSSDMALLMGLQLGGPTLDWLPMPTASTWTGGINGPNTADLAVDWVHVWTP